MKAHDKVKTHWSTIDVRPFGPYRESIHAALAQKMFANPALRMELTGHPATYRDEVGFDVPDNLEIIDKSDDEFIFVVPRVPPETELWYRYEQISNWWMLAHAFYWWMRREHGDAADPFLPALHVQIIGRAWTDMDWREDLLKDPRTALEEQTGGKFAPMLNIRAVEETDGHVLVLPTDPAKDPVASGAEFTASLFASAHTWWQWLVWPRLMRKIGDNEIGGMIK